MIVVLLHNAHTIFVKEGCTVGNAELGNLNVVNVPSGRTVNVPIIIGVLPLCIGACFAPEKHQEYAVVVTGGFLMFIDVHLPNDIRLYRDLFIGLQDYVHGLVFVPDNIMRLTPGARHDQVVVRSRGNERIAVVRPVGQIDISHAVFPCDRGDERAFGLRKLQSIRGAHGHIRGGHRPCVVEPNCGGNLVENVRADAVTHSRIKCEGIMEVPRAVVYLTGISKVERPIVEIKIDLEIDGTSVHLAYRDAKTARLSHSRAGMYRNLSGLSGVVRILFKPGGNIASAHVVVIERKHRAYLHGIEP